MCSLQGEIKGFLFFYAAVQISSRFCACVHEVGGIKLDSMKSTNLRVKCRGHPAHFFPPFRGRQKEVKFSGNAGVFEIREILCVRA